MTKSDVLRQYFTTFAYHPCSWCSGYTTACFAEAHHPFSVLESQQMSSDLSHHAQVVLLARPVSTQQIQNICITFVQCWTNVEYVETTLYKCYTNVLFLLGRQNWPKLSLKSFSSICSPQKDPGCQIFLKINCTVNLQKEFDLTLVLLNCFNCIFSHLKLELLTQFPASNDEK